MKQKLTGIRLCLFLCSMIIASSICGCSKGEHADIPQKAPVVTASNRAVQSKTLIDVIYDAAKFYAAGGKTFQTPEGISISRKSKGKGTDLVQITGSQQSAKTEAVITVSIPTSWLSSEKEKLNILEAEIKALAACSKKLTDKELSGNGEVQNDLDACKMSDVTENGSEGIAISDENVKHIKMMIFPRS